MKVTKYAKEAKSELKLGIQELTRAVGSTLGGAGQTVIIDTIHDQPFITADGITVAEHFDLEMNPFQQMGVQLVKHVCRETNREAGDGTTTATVLANAMLENEHLIQGRSFSSVKKGMKAAMDRIMAHLSLNTKNVRNFSDLCNIATISARNDKELGTLIAQAVEHAGEFGQVMVEEGKGEKDSLEFITGYSIPNGYISEFYANNKSKRIAEYKDAYVFATDMEALIMDDFVRFLTRYTQHFANKGNNFKAPPLVIITPRLSESIMKLVMDNQVRGAIQTCLVEAPEFGAMRTKTIDDLLTFLGGKACLEDSGVRMGDFEIENLGKVDNFYANHQMSVFTRDEQVDLSEYIAQIKETETNSDYKKKRVERLSGKLSKLIVVAGSPVEMQEKLDRVEDAKNATKAALEGGYVVGGGLALLRAAQNISEMYNDEDVSAGFELVRQACMVPFRTIVANLYREEIVNPPTSFIRSLFKRKNKHMEALIREVENSKNPDVGLDTKINEMGDLLKKGIVDPVKVTKAALKAATSVASTILGTNCVISIVGEQNANG